MKGDKAKAVAAAENAAMAAEDRLLSSIAEVFLGAGQKDRALAAFRALKRKDLQSDRWIKFHDSMVDSISDKPRKLNEELWFQTLKASFDADKKCSKSFLKIEYDEWSATLPEYVPPPDGPGEVMAIFIRAPRKRKGG